MVGNFGLEINDRNHLVIGGCDCVDLVREFGTPLYVMDETIIRNNMRLYKRTMDRCFQGKGLALYASKAFCTLAMCRIADQEGLGLDVVSGGELYTALKAGFPMDRVYFHGNNKTPDEICKAIDANIGRIVVDNIGELELINRLAGERNKRVKISFRIKPGIDAHTHVFTRTGQIDSKFGVALENGEANDFVAHALELPHVELVGVHCHIGSQIFEVEPFKKAARVMLRFMDDVRKRFGITMGELNLGGGFGVKYTEKDDPPEYNDAIDTVADTIRTVCDELGMEMPFILIEPGRSIAAPAGITLYTAGGVKDIKGVRKYISVDGGMTDNPRYALYQSEYTLLIANKAGAPRIETVTVAGKCCESGDLIAKDIKMPQVEAGDIIAVLATGAYNYSMSMNYNRNGRPPVVLVKDGKARLIVKREDYNDLIRNDLIPEDL